MKPIKVRYWWSYIVEHPDFTGCLIDVVNDKAWYKNGKCHREDGPAKEFATGEKYWCLNGVQYNEQNYRIALRKMKLERVLKKIICPFENYK